MGDDVIQVLTDRTSVALAPSTVDTFVDLEEVDLLSNQEQESLYNVLKEVLQPSGILVKLYVDAKQVIFKKLLASDSLSTKAKNILMPWKKTQLPTMHFSQYKWPTVTAKEDVTVKNGELSRHFS